MVQKSYGKMRGTRHKLRAKKKPAITRFLQEFEVGDLVHIDIVVNRKFPTAKFQGATGRVIEKRGGSYGVRFRDEGKFKTLYLRPEHLRRSEK